MDDGVAPVAEEVKIKIAPQTSAFGAEMNLFLTDNFEEVADSDFTITVPDYIFVEVDLKENTDMILQAK